MAYITRVHYSRLHLSARIDAEHYSPRFFPTLNQLRKLKTVKLRRTLQESVKTGHTPPTKNSAYYNPGVVRFIKTDNLREDRIDTFDIQFISELGNTQIASSELRPDDVIVTIIGATEDIIGRAARVYQNLGRANINQNIALIRSRILAGYLTVFLNSYYGREQLIWLSRQTGQVNLNCREVEELEIPLFSETFILGIHGLSNQCHDLLVTSEKLYKKAEQLLLADLGLLNWEPTRALTYVKNYSQVTKAQRIDAEYFHPKYDELREHIRRYSNGFLRITDIATNSDETAEPTAHAEDDYRYIELADIDQVIGTIESANKIKGKDAPSRARMLLRAGDVITSTVEGSLDKVALVSEEYDGAIGSTGFFVLRPRNIQSGYLLALVKSMIVREQMRCESSGTILAAISTKSLRNIIVPNIPPQKREEIAQLVEKSHAVRREAKALLEKAKRAVEIAIEENEKRAMESMG